MPKKYGVKEKDQVVAHILKLLLTGRLRTGDRVDRNEITAALGLSRVPVQEALVQLEHDGILETRYHRGAFVERFDAATLQEHHEVHGLLTGAVSARAAVDPRPDFLDRLDQTLAEMRGADGSPAYAEAAGRYRNIVVGEYAGPRLRAAIATSRSFMPRTFWDEYPDSREVLQPFAEVEHAAIHNHAPERARRACMDQADLMADFVIADLTRRGVFGGFDSP